jgi:hypothetical protein
MAKTFSEQLFEDYCAQHGISCERIPESDDAKTPDYELVLGDSRVVVEVKEIARNKEERESDRVMAERGHGNVLSHTPGDRVRRKIAACSHQLKARSKGVLPTLLVVFDTHGCRHVEPYNIRVAMYGLEQIHLEVPPIGQGRPKAIGMSHGPKRKMTPESNTSISAVAALVVPRPDEIHLSVYHNCFAAVPLSPSLLGRFGVPQLEIGEPTERGASEWHEVQPIVAIWE